jgi:acyl carrier protein
MNEFLEKIAGILEVSGLKANDDLKSLPQWDSLSILSITAMLDATYGVNFRATDFQSISTASDLWKLIENKKHQ